MFPARQVRRFRLLDLPEKAFFKILPQVDFLQEIHCLPRYSPHF